MWNERGEGYGGQTTSRLNEREKRTTMKFPRRSFLKQWAASVAVLPFLGSARSLGQTPMGNPKFVDVDGIRTRYFERGSGEALVLVHGGSIGRNASADGWAPLFGHLVEHFHVYAFDRLGMGETDNPKTDDGYSMRETAQHMHGFLQKVGIRSAHLVGSSRGALPVARVAVDHPDLTKSLIMFNSNTLAPDDQSTPVDYYYRLPRTEPASPKIAEAEKKMELLASRWAERNPGIAQFAKIDGPSVWWLRDLKYETLNMIRAGRLKAPTLIIWGFDDPSAPLILAYNLLNIIAPVVNPTQLRVINGAAHGPYRDQPEEVSRFIVDFINHLPH